MDRTTEKTPSAHARVSVITPTKNRLALLCEAMDSVYAQEFPHWNHIIVDDGSDDGTAEEVERRAKGDPRIKLIRRGGEKTGPNVCRNIGIRESDADYVLLLDSDDLLAPQCLGRRVALLDRNADVDFVTFQTSFFVESPGDRGAPPLPDFLGDDLTRFLYFELPWIITGPMWRRSSLIRIGLLDERLLSWQDVELHVRALTSGLRYLRFPEVDHHVRWQFETTKVSIEQRRSPRYLENGIEVLNLLEKHVRNGPGMNWVRQRALCNLYFFIAERWLGLRDLKAALSTWRQVRTRKIGTGSLHLSGALLLILGRAGLPTERLVRKWRGLMRLRTNPELVGP